MSFLLIFAFGAAVGSFLNVIILRTQSATASWIRGRSACPHCHHILAWYDMIPIVSFFLLRRQCRYCHARISWQYPLVELCTALLFATTYAAYAGSRSFLDLTPYEWMVLSRNLLAISLMVVLFVYDLRWQVIPDRFTLPAIVFFFVVNSIVQPHATLCAPLTGICYGISGWTDYLSGAILGAGFFFLQFVISKGKWIGGGDIRFGALMGVILGFTGTAIALFVAYMIGSLWGIGLIVSGKKQMDSAIPFGTFLAIATILVLLWQTQIIHIIQRFMLL